MARICAPGPGAFRRDSCAALTQASSLLEWAVVDRRPDPSRNYYAPGDHWMVRQLRRVRGRPSHFRQRRRWRCAGASSAGNENLQEHLFENIAGGWNRCLAADRRPIGGTPQATREMQKRPPSWPATVPTPAPSPAPSRSGAWSCCPATSIPYIFRKCRPSALKGNRTTLILLASPTGFEPVLPP